MLDGYNVKTVKALSEESNCIIVSVLTQQIKEVKNMIESIGRFKCFFYIKPYSD